ncbi:hybrid sensor histidine kinase/response regulator [Gaoshiqia sediminis]|uniref:histidine kinase n=1 Tax=Gaoshiqia sediminis TaxID=2986998 RepID=A0AA41Y6S8_9BACT|nr:hybrid sensor histidine kinase/response regulator transcription factor [Gaoshiqia sediminis]MCW0484469.1 ATP-binding protein [Gaoshiqia sediminis]
MRPFIRLLYVLIIVLVALLQGTGQPSYLFHHLSTEEGLSNSNVRTILKDSYGFLWIGTESGLNRYDGYGFKVYTENPDGDNTLLPNDILGLQEDGLGNIWINSVYGYTAYNRKKDSFVTDIVKLLQGLGMQVDRNYKVYVDKKQDLWVLSGQRAFFYDTSKKALKVFGIKVPVGEIVTTELSDDGECLYGLLKSGILWQINKFTGEQTFIDLHEYFKPEILDQYTQIYVDSRSGIWLYSWKTDEIIYREKTTPEWKILVLSSSVKIQSNGVLDIVDDGNGRVWIGTDHKGLFIFDRANESMINLLHDPGANSSIASNNVSCLFMDNNGIIWMGHNKKGISFYHDSFDKFINIVHPECKDISTIFEDRQGNVWLGTDGNGLFLAENIRKGEIRKLPMPNHAIVSLLEDRKGRIWIGTYLSGLFCYENGHFRHYTKENSKLASNDIWNLTEDRYGNLWIGSLGGGIQCLRSDKESFDSLIHVSEEVKHPLSVHYDGNDKLYVGTVFGLYLIDITTGNQTMYMGNFQWDQQYKQLLIGSVYKDEKDNIWLGHSTGMTLWDIKKDTLYYLDKESGLCDNIVRGITEDSNGKIWVTTSNGLSVFSTERDIHGSMNITNRNFSTKDGLKSNYFNNHSICQLQNGDILLGGTEGYTIVNPNKLAEKDQRPAKVIFTGLSLANNEIRVDSLYNGVKLLEHSMEYTSKLTFSYNDKLIALHFATGDLLNADKVRYAYRMDGFNDQWLPTQENKIVFSSLNPGSYKLFIKACNSDGVWNDEAVVLDITVTPPFYLSNWAITFYIFFVIGLVIFIIYRTRKHHHAKLERQRGQLKREQEAKLIEMKLRFFTNISHDLRTPLTLILTPLQTILSGVLDDGLRKKLNTVNKNAEQLLQLINTLLDFRKLDVGAETLRLQAGDFVHFIRELCHPFQAYAIDRHMKFTFSTEMEMLSMQFDPDKVQKIILNLLSNAFKYTPDGGSIKIRIYQEGDRVCVSVSDTGQGISNADKEHIFERFYQASQKQEKTGSGIGLHIVSEYARMHGGAVMVTDNEPQGSVFTLKLPVQEVGITEEFPPETVQYEEPFEQDGDQRLPAKPVLLLVDDNRDFCEFMADSLSDEYAVLLAYNGQEAAEQLRKNDVNIVVSDVMMPVMSGTELCARIKNNIEWSHIPVILLTARTAEEYQLEGLELGADDYLTKPFNFSLLKLRIRKFLEWTEKCHISFSQKMDVSPGEITITPLDEKLIEKAINVVEEHISDTEFSVEELGAAVGLSRSHLYKKLMSITGKGPAEFIRTIRLKRGRQLLGKSQLQIAEIAYAVGFNSPKRFSINFKNEFGISPSDYLRGQENKTGTDTDTPQ